MKPKINRRSPRLKAIVRWHASVSMLLAVPANVRVDIVTAHDPVALEIEQEATVSTE